jgi:hypothetical protein
MLTEKLARQEARAINRAKNAMTNFAAIARRLGEAFRTELPSDGND